MTNLGGRMDEPQFGSLVGRGEKRVPGKTFIGVRIPGNIQFIWFPTSFSIQFLELRVSMKDIGNDSLERLMRLRSGPCGELWFCGFDSDSLPWMQGLSSVAESSQVQFPCPLRIRCFAD